MSSYDSDSDWSDTYTTEEEPVFEQMVCYDDVIAELKLRHTRQERDPNVYIYFTEQVCPAIRRAYRHKQRSWIKKLWHWSW